jgi:transcription termination factor Rho
MPSEEATQFLLRRLAETKTNEEFFRLMAEGA